MNYLVILLKELVVLPKQEVKIELLKDVSKNIIESASNEEDNKVLVVAPLNPKEAMPSTDDLPKIGVVATIKNKLELSNGALRVTLKGERRVIVEDYFYSEKDSSILEAKTKVLDLPKFVLNEEEALKRKLKSTIKKYVDLNSDISNTIINTLEKSSDIDKITDIIAIFLPMNSSKKLEYMQMINPLNRAKELIIDIEEEIEILRLEEEIEDNIKLKMLDREKDYFLREKLKEIQTLLGENNLKELDVNEFSDRLEKLVLPFNTYEKISHEIKKYSHMPSDSPEAPVLRNYIDTVLSLPWNKSSIEINSLTNVKKVLNESHFGLKEIKERIYDYVEIKNITKQSMNPIICLVGPPGVGKTTIASSIAKSLGREFVKISVGGLNDSTELIGNRKTYLGASPGKIIQGIKRCGYDNPVVLIDEVDKMVKDHKGDPASILLEVLDQNQNKTFVDNYIEEPFNLSKVLFILTANDEYDIPYALYDRLEVIELNSYTVFEKIDIAKKYLIPKILHEYQNKDYKINISTEMLVLIIKHYTSESGVRELNRVLQKILRKVIINKLKKIDIKIIKDCLGEYKYNISNSNYSELIGISNALAYTNIGGIITKIEVTKYKGDGNTVITGRLGEVMSESVKVAFSYIKNKYKVDFKNYDVHIHFLEGGTKKDGPSAGVSVISALLSLYLNKKIDNNIAFTGEISLNGNVLRVGAVKDKVIAAINENIKTIYLPKDNENDIVDIPNKYLENINIKFISNYDEVYKELFN